MAAIKWWEFRGKKVKVVGYACFGSMAGSPLPDRVRYIAFIDKKLSLVNAKNYVSFLERLFVDEFTATFVVMKGWAANDCGGFSCYESKATPPGRYVIFDLKTKGMAYKKALVRLTAMRMVHEHSAIVTEFCKEKTKHRSLDKQFELFQQIHIDRATSCSHGLIYCYKGGYDAQICKKPLTLEQFLTNLKDSSKNTVFSHFV